MYKDAVLSNGQPVTFYYYPGDPGQAFIDFEGLDREALLKEAINGFWKEFPKWKNQF